MNKELGLFLLFDTDLVSNRMKKMINQSINIGMKYIYTILRKLVRKKDTVYETPIYMKKNINIDFTLNKGLFGKTIKIYSDKKGRILLKSVKVKKDEINDKKAFITFLFSSYFKEDSDFQEISLNFKQIKSELFISIIDSTLEKDNVEGLNKNIIKNIMDALIYESYNRDLYHPLKSTDKVKNFISRIFYLFNTNYTSYKQPFSNRLNAILDSAAGEKDFITIFLGFLYFAKMFQEGKKIDINQELKNHINISEKKDEKKKYNEFVSDIKSFIEYSIINNFYNSIYRDIETTADSHTGRIFHYYEKILYSFEKKAYEDIFQILKKMVSENLIKKKSEYYLFFRIFALSYFETNYPSSINKSITDIEKASTQNRFRYISSFINRLIIIEEPLIFKKDFFMVALPQKIKNFAFFGLIVYVFIFLVKLIDKTIIKYFVSFINRFNIISYKNILSVFNSKNAIDNDLLTSPGIFTNISNFLFSVDSGKYGLITVAALVIIFLLIIFLISIIYKYITKGCMVLINRLKERNVIFYMFINILTFFVLLNVTMEIIVFTTYKFKKPKILYVYSDENEDQKRNDDFVNRFMYTQGLYKNYNIVKVKSRNIKDDDAKVNTKYEKYSKIIINIDPYYYNEIDDYLKNIIEKWKAKSNYVNLEIIFLNRFPTGKINTFEGIPLLERLHVRSAIEDFGPYAVVMANDYITCYNHDGNKIKIKNNIFKRMKKRDESGMQDLIEKIKGAKKGKLEEKARQELNISYYYDFPKNYSTDQTSSVYIELDDKKIDDIYSPITSVVLPSSEKESSSSFNYHYTIQINKDDLKMNYFFPNSIEKNNFKNLLLNDLLTFKDKIYLRKIYKLSKNKKYYVKKTKLKKSENKYLNNLYSKLINVSTSKSFSVLSVDEKYLTIDSDLGNFAKNYIFHKSIIIKPNIFVFLIIQLLLIIILLFFLYLMSYINKKSLITVLISSVIIFLTTIVTVTVFSENVNIFFNPLNILMYLSIIYLFIFYLSQISGLTKNSTLVILSCVTCIPNIIHIVLSQIFGKLTIPDIFGFLIYNQFGWLIVLTMMIIIGIFSYLFFSFKFKIK